MAGSKSKARKLSTVVTYLEMRERPKSSHYAPAAAKWALMLAERPTISFYRYLYDTVGEPWLWYERRALGDDALSAVIHDELVDIYVLYADGVPAGFAELDRRKSPDIELAYFGLIPEFVGRGLGPYLLSQAMEEAWSHEPERLWVHTCTLDHPKALAVYQRAGFAPYKQETVEFEDPRQTGVLPAEAGTPT